MLPSVFSDITEKSAAAKYSDGMVSQCIDDSGTSTAGAAAAATATGAAAPAGA
eukprot:COSAG05_NODE_10646_length_554_cov_0.712088_1_plen_52_part_10